MSTKVRPTGTARLIVLALFTLLDGQQRADRAADEDPRSAYP
jgi:hypothetical protein